jgi:hypothetical protein
MPGKATKRYRVPAPPMPTLASRQIKNADTRCRHMVIRCNLKRSTTLGGAGRVLTREWFTSQSNHGPWVTPH